jgi:glycosyltransferase involved in cell wall biosynthesis
MGILYDAQNLVANGGTEYMLRNVERRVDPQLLSDVYISRNVGLLEKAPNDKTKILWTHEVPATPQTDPMEYASWRNRRWRSFHKVVFVSNWQMYEYVKTFQPNWGEWGNLKVLQNAIDPVETHTKPKDVIRLIYTSNPSRGLHLLYPAFKKLAEKYDNVVLDVYSSAQLYGNPHEDQRWESLFDSLRAHERINYHGSAPNDVVRAALQQSHIFAYPSVYGETSCISLIEAMSANMLCVHPNNAALFETSGGITNMYHFVPEEQAHIDYFYTLLDKAVQQYMSGDIEHLDAQKKYVDRVYSWDTRVPQWEEYLRGLKG